MAVELENVSTPNPFHISECENVCVCVGGGGGGGVQTAGIQSAKHFSLQPAWSFPTHAVKQCSLTW